MIINFQKQNNTKQKTKKAHGPHRSPEKQFLSNITLA